MYLSRRAIGAIFPLKQRVASLSLGTHFSLEMVFFTP